MALDIEVPPTRARRHHVIDHTRDLSEHVAEYGHLPLPATRDRAWQQTMVDRLQISGILGRGGAGFPSSIKLAGAVSGNGSGVVVVNGMEGEPASDKDKVLLSRAPHLVLDGAQLLAAATGASRILVCIPTGRDVIAALVQNAVEERLRQRFAPIPETIVRPPNRFVAGEESALVQWISNGRSLPMFRPDKSVPLRIGRSRALVHNAETLAHIALIARQGPEPFLSCGTPTEPGTMLVTVTGAVLHPGVVEVDRGTPIDRIVSLAHPSGGIMALLVGGYGGSWIAPEHFSFPYSAAALRSVGASAGVGVIVVLETPSCGLAETARVAHYLAQQSSGQCGPCVFGLPAIAADLALLAQGKAEAGLMSRLVRRLGAVEGRGACHHPDGVVTMIRSALDVFADDVAAHGRGEPCAHWARPTQLRFPDQRSERS